MRNEKRSAFTLIELLIVVAIIAILAAIAVPNFLEAQVRSKVSRAQADMRSLATAIEAYRVDQNAYPAAIAGDINGWDGQQDSNSTSPGTGAFNRADVLSINYASAQIYGTGDNAYWRCTFMISGLNPASVGNIAHLTTPSAYITSYPFDAFESERVVFGYVNMANTNWALWSCGPDNREQMGQADGVLNGWLGLDWNNHNNGGNPKSNAWNGPDGSKVCSPSVTNPTATLITGGWTYDSTNGSKSQGDIWRMKQ